MSIDVMMLHAHGKLNTSASYAVCHNALEALQPFIQPICEHGRLI